MRRALLAFIAVISVSAQVPLPSSGGGGGGGGSGSVTSITAGCGIDTGGSPITTTGTVAASEAVNSRAGTSYTILSSDCGKLITQSNASASAYTLPQAGGSFPAGWKTRLVNLGVGAMTITPTTSTINGSASVVVNQGEFITLTSNGTDYAATGNQFTVDSALSITRTQTGAVQIGAGASVVTLSGAQTLTNKAVGDKLVFAAVVAPATPSSGVGNVYVDSTSKNLSVKDDAGVVKHGAQTFTCTNQFVSALSDAGVFTCSSASSGVYFHNPMSDNQASSGQAGTGSSCSYVQGPSGSTLVGCTDAQMPVGIAGSAKNARLTTRTSQPAACDLVFTLAINGVNSSLVVTVPGGSAAGTFTDLTHTPSVAINDTLVWSVTNGTCTSAELRGINFQIQ